MPETLTDTEAALKAQLEQAGRALVEGREECERALALIRELLQEFGYSSPHPALRLISNGGDDA